MGVRARHGRWHGATAIAGAPTNTVAPVITTDGSPTTGETVTCSSGTWTGNATITYAYQWKRDGANISGATTNSRVLAAADVGHSVKCTVTATNGVASVSADSNTIAPAAPSVTLVSEIMADSPLGFWRGGVSVPVTVGAHLADSSGNNIFMTLYNTGSGVGYPKDAPSLISTDLTNPAIEFVPDANFWFPERLPSLELTTALSLEFWMKPAAAALSGGVRHDLVRKGANYGAYIEFLAGSYKVRSYVAIPGQIFADGPALVADVRHHIVVTYDGTNLRLWQDGVNVATTNGVGSASVQINENWAFGQLSSAANGFTGVLDEIALYNHALTGARILAHYNAAG